MWNAVSYANYSAYFLAATVIALSLGPVRASDGGGASHRGEALEFWPDARPQHRARRIGGGGFSRRATFTPPSPAIVTGYLPRNHGVPMYNEPPRRDPRW